MTSKKLSVLETKMTLKEITDLLEVRHNDAMNIVEKMATGPEFGLLRKIRTKQKTGFGEKEIDTYALDKRQSIAVSARLNTALLMRIIDRWQILEEKEKSRIESNASRSELRGDYRPMTDALVSSLDGKEIKPYHFSNEADLLNRIALGYTAAGFRTFHGVAKNESIRDYFTEMQKKCMISLQRANTVYLEDGVNFKDRESKLKSLFDRKFCQALINEVHLLSA